MSEKCYDNIPSTSEFGNEKRKSTNTILNNIQNQCNMTDNQTNDTSTIFLAIACILLFLLALIVFIEYNFNN